ncbi:glycosyltransferase [Microbacterium sp. NPDC076768]|uniref:glycosyltransferase n=1 Tax=Microbacterium sp. NPDC076768 TaxID=3154858 RepID=UPI00342595FF
MAEVRRIAYVVYNDVYRDSRVLKAADSAAAAGYMARIYAFGGELSHYPVGVERRASGAEIHRLPVFPDRYALVATAIRRRRAAAVPIPVVSSPGSAQEHERVADRGILKGKITRARTAFLRLRLRLAGAIREHGFRRTSRSAIIDWRPHLVHAHDANTLEIAMDVRRSTGVPFVYDAHELWEERNARRGRAARRRERRLLDRASKVMAGSITVSPSIQRWMTDRYDLAAPPILVRNIPHATTKIPAQELGRLRSLTGLSADQLVIAYVGGITSGRGIEEAISAVALLPSNNHFVLLGHGAAQARAEFEALARTLGVADRVHFAGSVESGEVSAAAADADVSLVYTQPKNLSYRFSLPNKLFESIHAGVPIVASDLPDVAELVRRYDLGELSSPTDVEALAAAIRSVLAEPERFRAGAAAAAAELSWEGEMERLLALYEEILESPAAGAGS